MKVRLASVRGRRCSAGVKQGQEWLFGSMKMKGLLLGHGASTISAFPWVASKKPF